VRVFLACCVEPEAAQRLHAALEPLNRFYAGPAYRATPPDNYHVTLRFFGELNQDEVDRVERRVRPIAAAAARIDCRATALLALPNARRPAVIGLTVESAGRIEMLASHVNRVVSEDFGPPDKPFKAHLSVIRCRRGARFEALPEDLNFELTFARIALFRSDPADDGPRYSVLQEFQLGTGGKTC